MPPTTPTQLPELTCNAEGIPHAAHAWDFGSGETFHCAGSPVDPDWDWCTEECPEDCEADHQGEE